MPRVSRQYKDDQRAEILAAARRCFVRNGFHRTSMQDVFTEAGKSAGAVYRYFPKKEDLIVGVAAQNLDDVAEVLSTALARGDGERGVGQVLAELLTAVTERHRDRQLAAMALMVWSEALRNPELARRLEAAATAMSEDVAALVRARQRDGAWAGAPADALAQVILSILPGFLFNLALLGPRGVAGFPDAVRTLWPD
ncbi:TetR/AcrR family transcriptional regulator [Amycolatopsis saalfeldensis]|uniref:DNA-binding transcriptional regulator, AcrR family n=1 Tax=Amycolatopsis saalfeldensis TaxID=394193 RepID=A0A1H8Y1T8_9PSEU|nr:TetR/AcrR family transcriptional regulator [Amycolatopsis saalfeldensis]SEP46007.1 DNA-binding transcriptional regulator, AcrR family [Amycolatopsis saalfeldensis]